MNLLLTFDYELFGDGSGNVFEHMIEPTERLLNICDRHNIKTTLFFEVVEYLKLKQEWDNNNSMGYKKNPIEAIERQLQKAACNGHDIQLHVHPQWIGAQYINHKWEVDNSNWRLSVFQGKNGYTIESLLQKGKMIIENLICQVVPDYKCIALRAGYYNIMPSTDVYAAMKKTGLKIDSSVYPGGYETSNVANFDYRQIQHNVDYWWTNPEDITRKSILHREILEIPVFALNIPRWRKMINLQRLKSIMIKKTTVSALSKSKITSMSLMEKFKFLFEKEASTWDFFLFDSGLHKRYLKYIDKKLSGERENFVLLAHPKSAFNEDAFLNLIEASKKRKADFKTITQLYKELNS